MSNEDRHPRNLLDERYARILQAVYRRGGTANTSEIKRLTGISTNQIITQRMDRLEEFGYVQTGYQPAPRDSTRMPTKTATLTGYGREVVESGVLNHFLDEDRVESVDELNERVGEIGRRVAALRDDLDDLSAQLGDVEELSDRVANIEEFLEQTGYEP